MTNDNRPKVPRFVRALNAVAEKAGFTVSVSVGRIWKTDEHDQIVSTWTGPRKAWRRLTFLSSTVAAKIHTGGGCITWPADTGRPIMRGVLELERREITLRLSGGAIPRAIRTEGKIEIVEYDDDAVLYFGTDAELIEHGICTEAHLPRERRRQLGWGKQDKEPNWHTRRYPDGSCLHYRETPSAFRRRLIELGEWRQRNGLEKCAPFVPALYEDGRTKIDSSDCAKTLKPARHGAVTVLEIAPGVIYSANGPYWQAVVGQEADLIRLGYADAHDFAPKPKRVKYLEAGGGDSITTTRLARGRCEIIVRPSARRRSPNLSSFDGNSKVAWSDCAWQPKRASDASRKGKRHG